MGRSGSGPVLPSQLWTWEPKGVNKCDTDNDMCQYRIKIRKSPHCENSSQCDACSKMFLHKRFWNSTHNMHLLQFKDHKKIRKSLDKKKGQLKTIQVASIYPLSLSMLLNRYNWDGFSLSDILHKSMLTNNTPFIPQAGQCTPWGTYRAAPIRHNAFTIW